jgi:hypothetical protein
MLLRRLTVIFVMFASLWVLPASASAEVCPNEAIRVERGSTDLANCRAYEMVSPPDKNGGDISAVPDRARAAADGSAMQFSSFSGFGHTSGSALDFEYISERTPGSGENGWSTHGIDPAHFEPTELLEILFGGGTEPHYVGELSPNLSTGVFISNGGSLLIPNTPNVAGQFNLYNRDDIRSTDTETYKLISDCPVCATTGPLPIKSYIIRPWFAGASSDFSHVIFESQQNLTQEAVEAGLSLENYKLYEWDNGNVYLAGILPDSECSGTPPCPAVSSAAGTVVHQENYPGTAISEDGHRIFFVAPRGGGDSPNGQLYMRVDNGLPGAGTVRIDASEQASPNACQSEPSSCLPATFATATPDGRYAFFWTKEKLIDEDTSNSNLAELYRYDAEAPAGHHLTLVSPDTQDGVGADIEGVIGASNDGSYVYFVTGQTLLPDEPEGLGPRIYVWHNGTVHKVAGIPPEDIEPVVDTTWTFISKTSRITPDGTRLVFAARGTEGLPHHGASDSCVDESNYPNQPCQEVYLYDATANGGEGRLTCASCGSPVDAPMTSDANFYQRVGRGATVLAEHLNHPLSDNGRYVFFSTADALVPEDTNGVRDVYEYDAVTGEQHLISSGQDKDPSYFMDASADGSDVFFETRERLSGWDVDSGRDIYDARIDGGLPEPLPAPASCAGDACQPPPTVLNDPTPSSVSFSGPGNPPLIHSKPKPHSKPKRHPKPKKHHAKRKKSHHKSRPAHSQSRR